MRCEEDVRELFVKNAIHLIAEGGFEKATTKNLTYSGGEIPGVKLNEVYIYRLFESKEGLYAEAFSQLDNELFDAFLSGVYSVGGFEEDTTKKLFSFFELAWRFVLKDEDRCRAYVRFYYSVYFKGEILERHNRHFAVVIDKLSPLFKEEADIHSILHSAFTALLDFAIRVYNKELVDNEINRPHVFNVLYCMMVTYFKRDIIKGTPITSLI